MHSRYLALVALCAILLTGLTPAAFGQEGSPVQRLEVMRSKLDAMRRSLNNAIASINASDEGDKEKDKNSPEMEGLTRLRGLDREVGSVLSDVADLRSKVDKAQRYETKDIERLEVSVNDLNTRVEAGLVATASLRKDEAVAGTPRKKKKKRGRFFGLLGGGGDDDKYEELTGTIAPGRDRELFELAAKEVRKGSYETGRLLFNTIITTYPDSQYLPLAKLAIADSFYLEGTTSALIQASAAYQDWLTFFPSDPLADKVMLKVAESEMRQMGLADRDVSRARKAEQRLKVLLQQYPDTPLRADVEKRLEEVQENLGMHNLKIADFYLNARYKNEKGGLKGAQSRLREIIEKWPKFSYMDKVLFNTGYTYQQEEEPDEAAKYYQRLVREFPNSEYVEKAVEQLNIIGAAVPEADPAARQKLPPERPGFMSNLKNEIFGIQPVTVSKNGVLISKDSKEGNDLIDIAIARGGQLPESTTRQSPTTARPANRTAPAPQNHDQQPAPTTPGNTP
jgi:outer membrane protein assembly factor BamD